MDTQGATRHQNLITLFRLAAQSMVDELLARMANAGYTGIRAPHSRVFEVLDAQGSRISEMAARGQMTHQSMSELVASLEAQGFVERRPDPRDERAKLICLTPRGRELLQRALTEIAQIEAAWLARLHQSGVEGDLPAALAAALHTPARDHDAQDDDAQDDESAS